MALGLLLVQPLLAAGALPGLRPPERRLWHRRIGWGLIAAVLLHIGGLYLTSPEDMVDALLLVAPTAFSVYGVVALLGLGLTAALVALRRRLGWRPLAWRLGHNAVAAVVVVASIVHALQIEGAMEPGSKLALCVLVLAATAAGLARVWLGAPGRRAAPE